MKILQILEAVEGGTRTHVDQLLRDLPVSWEKHYIFSSLRNPDYTNQIQDYQQMGINCYNVPMSRGLHIRQDVRAAKSIKKIIHEVQPDLVHAHSSKAGFLARLAVPKGIPLLYTPHCMYFPYQTGIKKIIYTWGEQFRSKRINRYIAVSDAEKKQIIDSLAPEEKIERIDNGIAVPEMAERSYDGPLQLLFPARAVPQKGWKYFLETAMKIHAELPDCTFIFAGEGAARSAYQAEIDAAGLSQVIILPGLVADMDSLFRTTAITVITSRWEGQPYAALESMAYACPVAAFDIPGMNEIVDDAVGILSPAFDCGHMAQKVIDLLKSPALISAKGKAGRKRIRSRYTRKKFIQLMTELYKRVLMQTSG